MEPDRYTFSNERGHVRPALEPNTVPAADLMAISVVSDVQAAIASCELARLKLLKYPILQDRPRKRAELLKFVTSHLFFLKKTAANLQEAIVDV
ncbi:MAG: hypothetical protein QMD46_12395 [Methanomicrobiales archaeon]|nr:hypothetical protein [Methanomicrobiales archaeon]